MQFLRCAYVALTLLTLASPAWADNAKGTLTLEGKTVALNVAQAMRVPQAGGQPFTLVVLTEKPIDLSSVTSSPDPYVTLLNYPPIDAITHAMVFIDGDRVSDNAHSAGSDTQFMASRKVGLEAKFAGGVNGPLEGSLRSTNAEMSVQIDVSFKAEIAKPTQ